MIIKNTTAGLINVQGIALVPGVETEIPEAQRELVERDIKGLPGIEAVNQRAKAAAKGKEQEEK